jgi:hypothetical protein
VKKLRKDKKNTSHEDPDGFNAANQRPNPELSGEPDCGLVLTVADRAVGRLIKVKPHSGELEVIRHIAIVNSKNAVTSFIYNVVFADGKSRQPPIHWWNWPRCLSHEVCRPRAARHALSRKHGRQERRYVHD